MTILEMIPTKRFSSRRAYFAIDVVMNTALASTVAIRLPSGGINHVSYQLTGDATLQVTNCTIEEIKADTAEWVNVTENNTVNPADCAIRQININGNTTLRVRCQ